MSKFKAKPITVLARLAAEKTELDAKAKALSNFIGNSDIFLSLDAAEQERLKEQNEVMWQYSEILGQRIEALKQGKRKVATTRQAYPELKKLCDHLGIDISKATSVSIHFDMESGVTYGLSAYATIADESDE